MDTFLFVGLWPRSRNVNNYSLEGTFTSGKFSGLWFLGKESIRNFPVETQLMSQDLHIFPGLHI